MKCKSICFCFKSDHQKKKQNETKNDGDSVIRSEEKSSNSHRKSGKKGEGKYAGNLDHGGSSSSSSNATGGAGGAAYSGMAVAAVTTAHLSAMEGSGCGSAHGGGGGGGDGG
ncbi:hypothetical protein LWI28_006413 [Acer negundo]|uniref:Uncharacterized protein n=1 Tax=Acer negundo TaxID=4023 RepID=A0AAD5JCC5_ACENE|nr:hypothetical protein LWI28_006413 [Acer negundo]